jgi:ATP synthase protein I
MAWRLSTELLVAVLIGLLLGYGLDKFFGTAPWILVIGAGLGFAAGIKNTLRMADRMDAKTADVPIGHDLPDDDYDEE